MTTYRLAFTGTENVPPFSRVVGIIDVESTSEVAARRCAVTFLGRKIRVRRIKRLDLDGPPEIPAAAQDDYFWE